ncbi:glutathione S-transferase family protein [Chelativorans sp. YIM 93263]|uniref:glutathione S-transferase family protein n=1 Tax=Chelativorans sp. YIM 93263 TaxID=2906648 RepID=UPI002379D3BA|nr:glutathione S-transferase family protein [Chelativorans sp. YIM 93263]
MLKFYHAPWSRSSAILWLLEELEVDYGLEIVDIREEGGAPEAYRAIQPNKKVPAIEHEDVVITERAAISIYLGDVFPNAGLAPAVGDPARGAYLSALVYHDAVFDPAVCARVHGLEYGSNDYPFGLFDDMLTYVERKLSSQPYIAGDRFTIADLQWAGGINFTMNILKALPERQIFKEYVERATDRPAFKRAQEKDAAMAAEIPFFQKMMAASEG